MDHISHPNDSWYIYLPGVYVACSDEFSDVCSLAEANGLVGFGPGIGIVTFELVPCPGAGCDVTGALPSTSLKSSCKISITHNGMFEKASSPNNFNLTVNLQNKYSSTIANSFHIYTDFYWAHPSFDFCFYLLSCVFLVSMVL